MEVAELSRGLSSALRYGYSDKKMARDFIVSTPGAKVVIYHESSSGLKSSIRVFSDYYLDALIFRSRNEQLFCDMVT
jgi:hypothetical protein